jgi:murein DD-endopeptidase MepM/ murein hydrolase activator NlpD
VIYSGFNGNLGNVVIVQNDTGDYSLYGHMLVGNQAELGQRIWPGDVIGLVGSTGARTTGNHLHYSVITKKAGEIINKSELPRNGGSIGIT